MTTESPESAPSGDKLIEGPRERRTYLGGADAAALMGVGAHGHTPFTVWRKKIGELDHGVPDPDQVRFLERRKRWEAPIIAMLREDFGGKIVGVNRRYGDKDHEFLAAEIDFDWVDPDGVVQNGEIKTVHPLAFGERNDWGEPGTAEVPVHYAAQCMHGLSVTGRDKCVLAAMVGLDNMVFYEIVRDEVTIAAMRERMLKFWMLNVLQRIPPDPINLNDYKQILGRMRGRPTQIDVTTHNALKRIQEIRHEQRVLAEEEEVVQTCVLDFLRREWRGDLQSDDALDDALLMFGPAVVARYNKQRGTSLDQRRLKVDHPQLVRQYTNEYFYRKLFFPKQ